MDIGCLVCFEHRDTVVSKLICAKNLQQQSTTPFNGLFERLIVFIYRGEGLRSFKTLFIQKN